MDSGNQALVPLASRSHPEASAITIVATSAGNTADLAAQTAIIVALTPVLPTLPAGTKAYFNTAGDLRRATQRRDNLTASQSQRGPVAALNRALDLRQVQVQQAEINVFVTEVTARRAAL